MTYTGLPDSCDQYRLQKCNSNYHGLKRATHFHENPIFALTLQSFNPKLKQSQQKQQWVLTACLSGNPAFRSAPRRNKKALNSEFGTGNWGHLKREASFQCLSRIWAVSQQNIWCATKVNYCLWGDIIPSGAGAPRAKRNQSRAEIISGGAAQQPQRKTTWQHRLTDSFFFFFLPKRSFQI